MYTNNYASLSDHDRRDPKATARHITSLPSMYPLSPPDVNELRRNITAYASASGRDRADTKRPIDISHVCICNTHTGQLNVPNAIWHMSGRQSLSSKRQRRLLHHRTKQNKLDAYATKTQQLPLLGGVAASAAPHTPALTHTHTHTHRAATRKHKTNT